MKNSGTYAMVVVGKKDPDGTKELLDWLDEGWYIVKATACEDTVQYILKIWPQDYEPND